MISVRSFTVGIMSTNTYIITDCATGLSAVIDPGCKDEHITATLSSIGKDKIKYVLLTHGHFDHIACAQEYAQMFGAEIAISSVEEPFLSDNNLNLSYLLGRSQLKPFCVDVTLKDGDTVKLGETILKFILTPGHTAGSGCFISEEDKIIFTGDTLFFGSIGRTDLPTGDGAELQRSLHRLRDIEGDYKVYPGHDRPTTLGHERQFNPYLR